MSHIDIRESGTCAALPLRDAWGGPRRSNWWSDPRAFAGTGHQVSTAAPTPPTLTMAR